MGISKEGVPRLTRKLVPITFYFNLDATDVLNNAPPHEDQTQLVRADFYVNGKNFVICLNKITSMFDD